LNIFSRYEELTPSNIFLPRKKVGTPTKMISDAEKMFSLTKHFFCGKIFIWHQFFFNGKKVPRRTSCGKKYGTLSRKYFRGIRKHFCE